MATAPALQLPDVEAMTAEEVAALGVRAVRQPLCLTCSWQKQSSVLVHMVFGELGLDIPVVELDTQLFFRETYETRDRLVERYGLKLERPEVITVAEQAIERRARTSGSAIRTAAATSARSSRSSARSRRTTPGSTGIRRDQSPSARGRRSGRVVGALRRLEGAARSPTGTRSASGRTSTSTRFRTTRCTTRAIRSIGCIPCTRPSFRARRSARAAGRARTSSSAASMATHDW